MKVWLSEVKRNETAKPFTGTEKCADIFARECVNSQTAATASINGVQKFSVPKCLYKFILVSLNADNKANPPQILLFIFTRSIFASASCRIIIKTAVKIIG